MLHSAIDSEEDTVGDLRILCLWMAQCRSTPGGHLGFSSSTSFRCYSWSSGLIGGITFNILAAELVI